MIIKLKPITFTTDNYYPLTYELIIELFSYIVNNNFPLIFIIINVINYNIIKLLVIHYPYMYETIPQKDTQSVQGYFYISHITKKDYERIVTYLS